MSSAANPKNQAMPYQRTVDEVVADLNTDAQRGLSDAQSRSGTCEAELFSDREEIPEVPELDILGHKWEVWGPRL